MSSETSPPSDLPLQVARAFARFGPTYKRWIESQVDPDGVSFARMRVIEAIHGRGPQAMGAIGTMLGVSARNVTSLLDGFEGEGLVRRAPHPTDRRATLIELTPAGKQFGCQAAFGKKLEGMADL